jgi:hypothetical protein
VRAVRIVPGRTVPTGHAGAILVRDLQVGQERWSKGRRLSAADLDRLGDREVAVDAGPRALTPGAEAGITVIILDPGDVHEDEAASRLAAAVAGPGTVLRGPAESRVDLLAAADGVLHVRVAALERINRIDPLEVFTLFDGQIVRAGDLLAGVKIGPHVVTAAVLEAGLAVAARSRPIVRVAPFVPRRVGVLVKESVRAVARERFEATVRAKVESLGSGISAFVYLPDTLDAVAAALLPMARGPDRVDVVLTAGAASTDPSDAFFGAIERLGGRVVRHGAPAHPGSMVWLAQVGGTDLLGLPSCGAYSKATAADLLLPRLLTGERAGTAMAAALGHGGVLSHAMRFRFAPYARGPEPP